MFIIKSRLYVSCFCHCSRVETFFLRMNVIEMKCWRAMVGVTHVGREKSEEALSSAGSERLLASNADHALHLSINHIFKIYWGIH